MTKSFPAVFILKEVYIEVINIATIKGNLTSPAYRIPIRSFRFGSVIGYMLISHSIKTTFFMYGGDCYTAKVALIFQGKDSGSPSSFILWVLWTGWEAIPTKKTCFRTIFKL